MENEDLKKENENLKEIITKKTDTISLMTHQVRTSLSGLKWIIKMFLDRDLGTLTTEQESLLKKGYDSNERAIGILTDLLFINKTENALEKEYSYESIEILSLIDGTVFDFSGEAHAKEIETIILKPEYLIPAVKGDKEKTRIVLQNLIENAIKYSDPKSKIFITIKETEGMVQVSIKDTGVGISEKGKEHIFEKFYRDPEAEKKEITGTGIGLYTIKQIIEKSGGKIWFESTIKEGTTFFFALPVYK